MIEKNKIDEAFNFYHINLQYKEKCYSCVNEINKSKSLSLLFKNLYNKLYIDVFDNVQNLWKYKNVDELFNSNVNPFITNIMILLGYNFHKVNMEKYNFNDEQVNIHKKRVKECFENDLINRQKSGVRISQMLWAVYFIRAKIIEIGSLQFEYVSDSKVKIHIPKKTDLNILKVEESIEQSKIEIRNTYSINNFKYICNSWLLSKQIYEIIDKNSNILKFSNLFNITQGEECIHDILNFVYEIDQCEDYSLLSENTSLQKMIKIQLLNGKKFYLGLGVLK